ncbi:MAG: peptidoglycan DD-metalloendopeptidase family protein [Ginsengibacter sp.]
MITKDSSLESLLKSYANEFHQVVKFNTSTEKLVALDFTENNVELNRINIKDVKEFSNYVFETLQRKAAKFGFGGYNELRVLYSRSNLFNGSLTEKENLISNEEPRRLHIGIDIWGAEGTEIYAPLGGTVHSFAFNNYFGDYGVTIILKHQVEAITFFTLYGHLSLRDIEDLKEGQELNRGEIFAHFGRSEENGHWPPHLHFQIVEDMGNYKGDYPGVCKFSEREEYLKNSPDPDIILKMRKFITE